MEKPLLSFEVLKDQLNALLAEAKQAVYKSEDLASLNQVRVNFLGKKGQLTIMLKSVGKLPNEEKPKIGKVVNEVKLAIQSHLDHQQSKLEAQQLHNKLAKETIDITLDGRGKPIGHFHPITRVKARVVEIFSSMGFQQAFGPEIEDEYHNFEALNIPANHPARAMADTFYLSGDHVLRTHTSPVQIRELKKQGVPIRLVALGRVFRKDSDQTHTPMFHQVEGLLIEEKCTFADLKGVLQAFLNLYFESQIKLRFRPSYFPFTEPSAEVDIYQPDKQRWLEVLGCGMVHPNVLKNVNIDPEKYSGYAFGVGLDRLAMLRYQIPDLRLLFENDIRFLAQF